MPDMGHESFISWSKMLGVTGDETHMKLLQAEVGVMLDRVSRLDEIDISDVSLEDAGLRQDRVDQ